MRGWIDQLPIWQWSAVMAACFFLGVAAAAATILVTGHHVSVWLFADGGACALFTASFGALTRHLRTRHNEKLG
jgi:hypothetical protein